MSREEEIQKFREELAEWRFSHARCHECRDLAIQYANMLDGEFRICSYHVSSAMRIVGNPYKDHSYK